ncbi:universal stress protein [uncultured Desulfosarcina sp.]|uniref:universal stress protein n=1 Tax=uncultured Desulfosarcina sp. TaxID=218289 RepID=UPI0029C6D6CC|nr:universal stress protein [uncultured Desulfosarcina sp.]
MYKTILVPLDGSERAEAILPHVEPLALTLKSDVVLLYVDGTDNLMLGRDEVVDINDFLEKRRARIKEKRAYLQNIVDHWRPVGIDARICIGRGSVVAGILDMAEQEKADLVAMASHGQSGSKRTFYGSVAVGVLNRIDRPLLLIRSRIVEPAISA